MSTVIDFYSRKRITPMATPTDDTPEYRAEEILKRRLEELHLTSLQRVKALQRCRNAIRQGATIWQAAREGQAFAESILRPATRHLPPDGPSAA